MGCDGIRPKSIIIPANFNPRTHVGCDFFPQLNISVIKHFNPRTHVGCDGHITSCTLYIANFNPRTHVGCDVAITAGLSATRISIHAPTWGATRPLYFLHSVTTISIHAPTWGATSIVESNDFAGDDFNPRTHVGCDISFSNVFLSTMHFNPRTHVGCDVICPASVKYNWKFQSTHPRGVRPGISAGASTPDNFNPRTHVGCDSRADLPIVVIKNFNPRTHVGCDC